MNNKSIGDIGEEIAVQYLISIGYKIIERNKKIANIEVDIIAKYDDNIIFCEVKTRSNYNFGSPSESVSKARQKRYVMAAKVYLQYSRIKNQNVRFDVIEVVDEDINHIEGAFDAF